jgi:acyl-CoA reductase-like NAD-dependent aldehyde dehydrogenase
MANLITKFYKKEITDALAAETLKVALFTSSYTPSANTDELYSGLTGEVSDSGTGYTTGGATLASKASAYIETTNAALDAADASWSAATFTARYAVVYNTADSKIRAVYDFGVDKVATGATFTLQFHADGLLKVS